VAENRVKGIEPEVLKHMMEMHIPFNKYLGVRVAEVRRGFCRMEIPFRDDLIGDPLRPALHGGVLSALADTAGGMAVWSGVDDERGRVSTIDLRVDYLRPAKLETLVAEATVVRHGNRVGVADVRLFHPSQATETVATGKGVYNITIVKPKGDR
jgi:uncharacterized protein (TIGR00369 family)